MARHPDPVRPRLSTALLTGVLPGTLAVLALAGGALQWRFAAVMTSAFDAGLLDQATTLKVITEQDEDGVEFELSADTQPAYFAAQKPDYFQISSSPGERLFASASLEGSWLQVCAGIAFPAANTLPGTRYIDCLLPDGRRGRAIASGYYPKIDIDDESGAVLDTPFASPGAIVLVEGQRIVPERLQLLLATSREPLDRTLQQLAFSLLALGALMTLLIVWLTQRSVRETVAPLETFTAELGSLDEDALTQRFSTTAGTQEVHELVDRFNALLGRLQGAFERERRFSANVAHELRTPLAELRSHVDVGRRFPDDGTLRASFRDDVDAASQRMLSLTENLLALSRDESGLDTAQGECDLIALLNKLEVSFAERLSQRSLQLHLDYGNTTPVLVVGKDHWPALMTNLVDNAVSHSSAHSRIDIALRTLHDGHRFELWIENTAPMLADADMAHLFDRLWRKDASRSMGRHSGLGLSLVAAYAHRLGVDLDAALRNGRIRFTLQGDRRAGPTRR